MHVPSRDQIPSLSLFAVLVGVILLFSSVASAAPVTSFPDDSDDDDAPVTVEDHEHAEVEARVRKQRRRSVLGDLNSRWFHVGGGGGMIVDPYTQQASPAGRFVLGGGGYTIGLYGGGGMEVSASAITTPSLSGVGYFGVAIPAPVVHPLLGVRGHVGVHPNAQELSTSRSALVVGPHVGAGLQAGFIIREFDGRPGVRLMLDAGAEYRPSDGKVRPDVFLTAAAVF